MFRRLAEEGAAATRESLATAGPLDLVEESRRAFADFAPDIAGAAVFLDDGAAETAHYACGASFLLGLGARNVFALPVASAATTANAFPDDRTDDGRACFSRSANDPSEESLAALVDVAGAPLPADAPVVIFTHRFLKTVAPDVVALVRQRPRASRVLVATAAAAEAHAAGERAAARAAGASAAAANEIAADAEAKQERALRASVLSVLLAGDSAAGDASSSSRDERHEGRGEPTKRRSAELDDAESAENANAFAAADWGDWGSDDDAGDDDARVPARSTRVRTDLDAEGTMRANEESGVERDTRFSNPDELPTRRASTNDARFVAARFPAPFVPLSAGAFAFPADSAAATARLSARRERDRDERATLCPSYEDGTEEDGGDAPAPAGVGVLAATLAHIGYTVAGFSRFECFALGRTARAVARAVSAAGPPAERRRDHQQRRDGKPCALVLVDRVADLATPALDAAFRGEEDDAFLAAAARLRFSKTGNARATTPPRKTFARTDLAFRFGDPKKKTLDACDARAIGSNPPRCVSGDCVPVVGGTLAHPNDAEARRFADASTRRTLLQTAVAARRWVADAARAEGVVFSPNGGSDVSSAELRSSLVPFLCDPRLRLRRGAMVQTVSLVAACLEDGEAETAERQKSSPDVATRLDADADAGDGFSFAAAAREMARDAANAVAARAGEGAAAAAVAESLRRTLSRAGRPLEEGGPKKKKKTRGLTATTAAALAVAAYAAAGEAAAFERRALGLGRVDFGSLEDEEAFFDDQESDGGAATTEGEDSLKNRRDAARLASASPFARGDESRLRDALADFLVASFSRSDDPEDHLDEDELDELDELDETANEPPPAWLGADLASRLASSRNRECAALVGETRDACERFLRSLGDVALARRRYASCGSLVDFVEAGRGSASTGRLGDTHRSLVKELAERVSVGADGGAAAADDEPNACDDVAHVASSLGGFLKSGVGGVLGSFGLRGPPLVSKPKPSDAPTVLIFVLGGITAREICSARAAAAAVARGAGFFGDAEPRAEVEDIIVGSTGLLCGSGEDLVAMVG